MKSLILKQAVRMTSTTVLDKGSRHMKTKELKRKMHARGSMENINAWKIDTCLPFMKLLDD